MGNILNGLLTVFNVVSKFANNHPMITALGISAVAGAFSPDELDIEKARNRREDELYRRRNKNRAVGDIRLGRSESSRAFQEQSGIATSPMSLINSGIDPRRRV